MFSKVLIANRGAIACRIIRTLRAMGIASVAVYTDADAESLHVEQADEAFCIGEGPAASSYLLADKILEVAQRCGAQAIHPGYGFLSENPDFAEACEAAGIAFIGPTPAQMRAFGFKHEARALAMTHEVPLLPGSGLLADAGVALAEARRIGFPVMLKSTAGGGGIGMRLIWSESELAEAYASVERLARANFKEAGIFLEKYVEQARHIEVQIFGDGQGDVIALGERDCSVQRRNQKVIEETPAPHLSDAQRARLFEASVRLGKAVSYRSAGTVEFVFDAASGEFYFLEVNTRLQVEHGVTEEVTGVDLVEWMIRCAAGELALVQPTPKGASIQVRLYAEDPGRDFQPCTGLLTQVRFSELARVETWVRAGNSVSPFYDPMVAKLIVTADDRDTAVAKMAAVLADTAIAGIETNLAYLRQIIGDDVFGNGRQTTRYLNTLRYRSAALEVLEPGVQSTVQDWPGRLGYWDVGVPPSGPMDSFALRLANRLVGNAEGAAALECTLSGPVLRFRHDTIFAVTGADMQPTLDGKPVALWQAHPVTAGSVLALGAIQGGGGRAYLAVAGGLDVPEYLGSCATFTLGQFGGHAGRTLRTGDVLRVHDGAGCKPHTLDPALVPAYGKTWTIGVMYGPHGAPDFFTPEDIDTFFATDWEVHYNSSRTGVRLIGPKPQWARKDGGEAGLHPSNIHDNAYAIGAVDFTGDMPVILGPDGPSLGGFVCPVTIIDAELWKMGQLRPGDRIRFHPVTLEQATALAAARESAVSTLKASSALALPAAATRGQPVVATREASADHVGAVYRQAGDRYLLVEYGPLVLDLELRFRVHALMTWIKAQGVPGLLDLTPGIRSLQFHFDPAVLPRDRLLELLAQAEDELGAVDDMEVPTRIVHLPLSWDDAATRLAIERYMTAVRPDAPWCPSNIEFIRRINGLDSIEAVKKIVFDASYLVLGLGDVYLGAPVATPVDPRHRLVTTKYNPARTWTPENAVGIGGAYMCVYGMEGPGGYQFVGRTVQMWNRYRVTEDFKAGTPWLLRFFDQIRFYPVSEEELLQLRQDFPAGRFKLLVVEQTFRLKDYRAYLAEHAAEIEAFKSTQQASFDAERERWKAAGQAEYLSDAVIAEAGPDSELDLPEGARLVASPVAGSVWKVMVKEGDVVKAGETLVVLESMKMEFPVVAPVAGTVHWIGCKEGGQAQAGQDILALAG
ncbi:MAG TPA: urea carboxylase [Fluviicoccus sp.]|nr:urea carboxylase [Fluviicoccus sp.]